MLDIRDRSAEGCLDVRRCSAWVWPRPGVSWAVSLTWHCLSLCLGPTLESPPLPPPPPFTAPVPAAGWTYGWHTSPGVMPEGWRRYSVGLGSLEKQVVPENRCWLQQESSSHTCVLNSRSLSPRTASTHTNTLTEESSGFHPDAKEAPECSEVSLNKLSCSFTCLQSHVWCPHWCHGMRSTLSYECSSVVLFITWLAQMFFQLLSPNRTKMAEPPFLSRTLDLFSRH